MALTGKQHKFVTEYLKCWNATESARRAGYAYPNVEGPKNLVKPSISKIIDQKKDEMMMSADEALTRISEQARADYSHYLEPSGYVDLEAMLSDGKGHLVRKIKHTKEGLEVEFYDAQTALQLIGKHHKLFTDHYEVEHKNLPPIQVVEAVRPDDSD